MSNKNLHQSLRLKNDEFYTQLKDIESELKHYKHHFKDKIVYCNCDDHRSEFFQYFCENFHELGLKKIIATQYSKNIKLEFNGDGQGYKSYEIKGNGDFRSPACIEILKEADIVVTNPPFSLFREFVKHLMKYDKKFLIIGNYNSILSFDISPLFQANKMWFGVSKRSMDFWTPGKEFPERILKRVNAVWYTNLEHGKQVKEFLPLTETYTPEKYPIYDNYDAIEVSRTRDIPKDYKAKMGVPITFYEKYNPDQFEFIGTNISESKKLKRSKFDFYVGGERVYARLIIRNKRL